MVALQKWAPLPTDLLGRVRWLLLLVNVVAFVFAVPLAVLPATSSALLRGLVCVALGWLALRSVRVYHAEVGAAGWVLLEGVLFLLVGLSVDNTLAVRGVMNASLSLRALYGSARQVAITVAMYVAALLGTALLSVPRATGVNAPPQAVTGALTLTIVATLMYLVALSIRRADAAQAEVERLNAQLERRVEDRTAQLEVANRELRAEIAERQRAEAALRESEAHYRGLVETSSDGIVLTDLEANVLLCNEASATLVGYASPADLVGRCAFDLVAPEDRERAMASLREVLATGRIRAVEHTLHRRDGSAVPVEISASLAVDATEEPRHLVAIVRDVTERKQAEAELQQAQTLEARLEGIVLAAREVGHLLNNDLAIAIVTMDVLQGQPGLPLQLTEMVADAATGLAQAEAHIRRFQQVVRVEVKETPLGPALDLDRSAPPPAS